MVDISTKVWSAKQITDLDKNNILKYDNLIQRSLVWEKKRKSELIHSLLEGFPVPPLYAGKIDGKIYDIFDGKQRIDAIKGYINEEYYLIGIDNVEIGDGEIVDVNGKKFSDLPNELQDRILEYKLDIKYFENPSINQIRIMFNKLNNGKPLSTKERNIANCIDIKKVSELGQHELFNYILTARAKATRKQIPLIMKTWMMLYEEIDDVSFASNDFNEVMQTVQITDDEAKEIEEVLDKILAVYKVLEDQNNKVRKTIIKETHMISLIPFIKKSVDEDIDEEDLAEFLSDLFTDTTVSKKYEDACHAGSASNANIKIRHEELEKKWNNF